MDCEFRQTDLTNLKKRVFFVPNLRGGAPWFVFRMGITVRQCRPDRMILPNVECITVHRRRPECMVLPFLCVHHRPTMPSR